MIIIKLAVDLDERDVYLDAPYDSVMIDKRLREEISKTVTSFLVLIARLDKSDGIRN